MCWKILHINAFKVQIYTLLSVPQHSIQAEIKEKYKISVYCVCICDVHVLEG